MTLQDDLLMLGNREASMLSDVEIKNKIETTMGSMFTRVGSMLLISFGIAYGISTGLLPIPFTLAGFWISMLGGFGIIIRISRKRQTLQKQTISIALLLFALLEGYGLTGVFASYGIGAIQQVFLTTAILFLALSVAGRYLDINITKVGPILFVSLIALLVSMLINMFWANEQFSIWINIIGVVIFSGLIMYDMNVMKQQALMNDDRLPLLMALSMFLNFINLFLFLLRLIGGSKN